MPPEVTAEEWTNMAEAANRSGIHTGSGGLKEKLSSLANIKDRKILGRPLYEVVADFGAGFAVKSAVRAGVMMAGASTLGAIGAAVVAGAASGAVFAGSKEWLKQVRENWQQPLPPEAATKRQKLLERLQDLNPHNWKTVGLVTLRGAAIGAVFGLAGGLLAEALHAGAPSGGEHAESAAPTIEPTHTTGTLDGTATMDHATTSTATNIPAHGPIPDTTTPSAPPTEIPTTTPIHTDIPGPQSDSPHIPAHGPIPDTTTPSHSPDSIPTHPADAPNTHPTEVPTSPTQSGGMPPFTEHTVTPPIDAINESIANLKDIPLPAGSNPWEVATEILKQVDPNHVPTNAGIMEVTRALAEQNDISVPEWGISGSIDEHRIPLGYLIKLTPTVKSVIINVVKEAK